MKNLRILLAALFIAVSFAGPTTAVAETAKHSLLIKRTSVSAQQVVDYLNALGYKVLTWPVLQSDGSTYVCSTCYQGVNYYTYTYCNATSIIGHDDVPQ